MINNEQDIIDALAPALGGVQVYHLRAPQGANLPYVIFQEAGGKDFTTVCGPTNKQNQRYRFTAITQVSIIGPMLLRKIARVLSAPPILAVSLGGPSSGDSADTRRFSTWQDLSVWFSPQP